MTEPFDRSDLLTADESLSTVGLGNPKLTSLEDLCAAEQIHIPGSIQPHGLLLVLERSTFKVVAVAGDVEAFFPCPWQDASVEQLLGQGISDQLRADCCTAQAEMSYEKIQGLGRVFDAVARLTEAHVLVELETTASSRRSAVELVSQLDAINNLFDRAKNLSGLCEAAASAFRSEAEFDRVMVYQFLDDDSGVVVAEAKADHLSSFLHHHFPATDIPVQARELYVRNRVRVIPNVAYTPAAIRPTGWNPTLDMSDVSLRSVSPVHIRYLKNMDVAASASVSIVLNGRLWGLIACHHSSSREIPLRTRTAFKVMAGSLARAISAMEEAETFRERLRLRAFEDNIMERLNEDNSLTNGFQGVADDLRTMLGASGFASVEGDEVCTSGHCPPQEAISMISAWLTQRSVARPFSTFCLTNHLPQAQPFAGLASGLLTLTMPSPEPMTLMWFRAERVEVVNWAGNPHKDVTLDPHAVLNPRTSFAAWSETVRGHSEHWTPGEILAANRIRRIIFEARQSKRLRSLNHELASTIADKESLIELKDHLIREVDHRVQNSLQLVSSFLAMQARTSTNTDVADQLAEAQRRIAAVALVHRRLYSDGHVETVDLGRYLEDLCADMKRALGQEWSVQLSTEFVPLLMTTSRSVNIGLILTELIINAHKYAYGGSAGPLHICLGTYVRDFCLSVADKGVGKRAGHAGFGTKMLAAMTSGLSGAITEHDEQPGLRVCLIAPIEEVNR